ncbi:hypothetical protein ACHWQZ_G019566 [Mnemiopsis leidyi]
MEDTRNKILLARYVAPVFTPRDETRNVNYSIIPKYVNYLISTGVQGILVGGSAGQGILQPNSERLSVARAFIAAADGRITVIVHAGGVNYEDTLSLCRELSVTEGVDGIMLSSPMFYPYYTYSGMLEFLCDAGKACNGKPVLYYHFPSLTRLQYDVVDLVKSLKKRLRNFVGLKYTANDEEIYKRLVKQKIKIFLGFPSMTLVGAQTQGGQVSLITGPTNFVNGVMVRIVDLVLEGNSRKAKTIQKDLDDLMTMVVVEQELMSAMTHVMDFVGLPMGPPVKPLSDLTESQKRIMKGNLNKVGSEGKYIDMLDRYDAHTETASIYTSYLLIGTLAYLFYKLVNTKVNSS